MWQKFKENWTKPVIFRLGWFCSSVHGCINGISTSLIMRWAMEGKVVGASLTGCVCNLKKKKRKEILLGIKVTLTLVS